MKKLIALLLSLLMVFSFSACSELGISEEEITSAVVDAIIEGIENGISESVSQEDTETSILESETKDEANYEDVIIEEEPESEIEEEFTSSEAEEEIKTEISSEESDVFLEEEVVTTHTLDEFGDYYTKDEVALYIHTYNKLPVNFITKDEARDLGWEGGSVEVYGEGLAIGGDKFGNREGILPKAKGRQYYECDIDTLGKNSRGAKRIVYSNDGLIYYTDDHYETFTLLYGEE